MATQAVFEFCGDVPARPRKAERLFFALMPQEAEAQTITRFADDFLREQALSGARITPDRLHLSLHHLGDFKRLPPAIVYGARLAGGAVAMEAFTMAFHGITSFDNKKHRRPLVLLGQGRALSELHERLGKALQRNGLRREAAFTPHMTLLYGAAAIPARVIEPLVLLVRDFVLLHSEKGLSRYHVLQRWPLAECS